METSDRQHDCLRPATKPFIEALKSLQVNINAKLEVNHDTTAARNNLDAIHRLDRKFGTVVAFSTSQTDPKPPHEKLDLALVAVDASRHTDNRLSQVNEYHDQISMGSGGRQSIHAEYECQLR
jgi:hypothetical protein